MTLAGSENLCDRLLNMRIIIKLLEAVTNFIRAISELIREFKR